MVISKFVFGAGNIKSLESGLEKWEIVQWDKASNKTLLFDKMATTNQLAPPL